jgi:hypothetical protein
MRYERVSFTSETGTRRTVILRVTGDSALFISGIEVDKEGDAVRHGAVDETRHLIDKTLILRRTPMTMNMTYAQLEVTR